MHKQLIGIYNIRKYSEQYDVGDIVNHPHLVEGKKSYKECIDTLIDYRKQAWQVRSESDTMPCIVVQVHGRWAVHTTIVDGSQ